MSRPHRPLLPVLAAFGLLLPAPALSQDADSVSAAPAPAPPPFLPIAATRDVPAGGRLFERGIPVTDAAFSPDGFHFAYLHQVPGGFFRRRPERCAFLLDLGTGEIRPVKTPKGAAVRVGGWDSTGRYLLIEANHPDLLSALTGGWTTYHWILDVVTTEFVQRKPFTGRRDGTRFLWKQRGTYHGVWDDEKHAHVKPLFEGELADIYRRREAALFTEDERRRAQAERLALGTGGAPEQVLTPVLSRLDEHWTRRGQRDPVISDLFGNRPALYVQRDDAWSEVVPEVDFVAVLDHDLVLITPPRGNPVVLNQGTGEMLPLPEAPEGWMEVLDQRWNRTSGFYDDTDPLPRDLQYRRSFSMGQGTGYYFNYVVPDLSRLLILYSFGSNRRVLRIVDLPTAWRTGTDAR